MPTADDALFEQIEARRNDTAFMARLAASIERNRPILDALAASECTGVAAVWCPHHGDCTCTDRESGLYERHCPLHGMDSTHADYDGPDRDRP